MKIREDYLHCQALRANVSEMNGQIELSYSLPRLLVRWGIKADARWLLKWFYTAVDRIQVSGPTIDDTWVRRLSRYRNLRSLELFDTRVTDAGLAALPPQPELDVLYLTGAAVTDLNFLKSSSNLTTLNLDRSTITDVSLAAVSPLQRLRLLALSGTRVTDAGMPSVARYTSITYLKLSGTQVTDAGLHTLRSLTNLSRLHLDNTAVTNASLSTLEALPKLEYVRLIGTKVTRDGIQRLRLARPALRIAADVQ